MVKVASPKISYICNMYIAFHKPSLEPPQTFPASSTTTYRHKHTVTLHVMSCSEIH